MNRFFNTGVMVAIAASATIISSCSSEENVYNPDYKQEQYAQNWKTQFGEIDPNQDWNMATQVTANVNVSGVTGNGTLCVYSADPFTEDASLLAKISLTGGQGTIKFDASKAATQVYATVRSGNYFATQGYFNIENGSVTINNSPVAQAKALTRAGETCNVTVGDKVTLNPSYYDMVITAAQQKETWDGISYVGTQSGNEGVKYKYENGDWYKEINGTWVKGTYSNSSGLQFYNFDNNTDYNCQLAPDGSISSYGIKKDATYETIPADTTYYSYGDFYKLNGVERTAAKPWKQGVGYGLYGTGKFFQESVVYWDAKKKSLTGYDLEAIEKGASIKTTGAGEINVPFIYGATTYQNIFGYFYYKDGQDPAKAPRYILIDDARPASNIYHDKWGGTAVSGMELSVWSNYETLLNAKDDTPQVYEVANGNTPMKRYQDAYNKEYYGTNYKMVYFGENYNEAGTYIFPADLHIEFFIMNVSDIESPSYNGNASTFNYGNPDLNLEIKHYYGGVGSLAKDETRGAMKATMWKYNGDVYVGFEDGGGDEDLNDIVFMIEGDIEEPEIVVPDPDEPAVESQTWTVACEDLGSTDDYDFNDVVFEVTRVAGSTEITFTPLAAGGTLSSTVYFNNEEVGEIHSLLNPALTVAEGESYPMYNTSSWNYTGASKTYTVDSDFSMTDAMGGFKILVQNGNEAVEITAPDDGTAPQMILIDDKWDWPTERTGIATSYEKFSGWSESAGTNLDWHETPTGPVISRPNN